jgi:hypothetical protein
LGLESALSDIEKQRDLSWDPAANKKRKNKLITHYSLIPTLFRSLFAGPLITTPSLVNRDP